MKTQDLRARVKVDGKEVYLGKFPTPEEARNEEEEYCLDYDLPPRRRKK